MSFAWPRFPPVMVLLLVLGLAACQSAEDRAEGHYQNALALVAEGDFDRAKVEFRNVFQNDGLHREARSDYARLLRENQEVQESYSQYLRLVEQYPDDAEGRIALAEMSLLFQNFEDAERHGRRAIALAGEDPRTAVIALNLDYSAAVNAEDVPARRALAQEAAGLQQDDPQNLLLMQLQIDNAVRDRDLEQALRIVDMALEATPANRQLQDIRLAALAELGRDEALAPQLLQMIELFPEDEELALTLLRLYLSRTESDQAVAFLRERARTAETSERRQDARVTLVQLVRQLEGGGAAIAALDEIIEETDESTAVLRGLRASIRFEDGDRERGLAEMQEILDGDLAVSEQGALRVALAQMLLQSGNAVGAQAQVEQVLEIDSVQVDALKMQARWFIEQDNPDQAIAVLRRALDEQPSDAQALTLMADAHTRNGNRELAREFLALAVEASNSAPDETIRFARTLIEQERPLRAEGLLIDALRLAPGDTALLSMLGNLYVDMEDWGRAEQVERTLRSSGDPEQAQVADSLQTVRLASQGRMEDAISFLEGIAAQAGSADLGAQVALIRARLANNQTAEALAMAEELRAANPDEPGFQFVLGAAQIAAGELPAAEATYRTLTETLPQAQPGWIGLIRTLNLQGRVEEAEAALEQALTQLPDALELLWAQASLRERAGDFEGAIALYEVMYERAPTSEVIANNLASMLSTYRADDESLDRAWNVARRLRGLDVPPFQDTYGWIAYRRGDFDEALAHLEPAAAALADNPLVQFHLGMTYAALERPTEALEVLQRAVEIAGPEDTRSQFDTARAEIARLSGVVSEPVTVQSSDSLPSSAITVDSADALANSYDTLSRGSGGTIYLGPRADGMELRLQGGGRAAVTIASEDPADPVTVSLIFLQNVQNVTVRDLAVDSTGVSGREDWLEDVMVMESRDVILSGLRLRSDARRAALSRAQVAGSLGQIRNSSGVQFVGNTVSGYLHGLTIRESTDIEITRSRFRQMQGDGIRMGGVQNLTIAGNVFEDWLGSSHEVNHDDMIQLWTTRAELQSRDIVVADNIFDSGNGVATQTIFFGNESLREGGPEVLHRDITVRGNVIYGGHHHGISINGASGVRITDNTILWNARATMREQGVDRNLVPTINTSRVRNARIEDNIVPGLALEGGVTTSNNHVLNYASPADAAYVERHFSGAMGGNVAIESVQVIPSSPLTELGSALLR